MAQDASGQTSPATPVSGLLTALIAGRIVSKGRFKTREGGTVHVTVVKLAAADEFSSPETIEVRSKEPLGDLGDTCRAKVRIGGYGRSYTKEGPDGEKVRVQTADNHLTVVG